jgi:hypothetical protein
MNLICVPLQQQPNPPQQTFFIDLTADPDLSLVAYQVSLILLMGALFRLALFRLALFRLALFRLALFRLALFRLALFRHSGLRQSSQRHSGLRQ